MIYKNTQVIDDTTESVDLLSVDGFPNITVSLGKPDDDAGELDGWVDIYINTMDIPSIRAGISEYFGCTLDEIEIIGN